MFSLVFCINWTWNMIWSKPKSHITTNTIFLSNNHDLSTMASKVLRQCAYLVFVMYFISLQILCLHIFVSLVKIRSYFMTTLCRKPGNCNSISSFYQMCLFLWPVTTSSNADCSVPKDWGVKEGIKVTLSVFLFNRCDSLSRRLWEQTMKKIMICNL